MTTVCKRKPVRRSDYYDCPDPYRLYRNPLRERVAAFFLAHHPPGPVAALGLPGVGWQFERLLHSKVDPDRPFSAVGLEDGVPYPDVVDTAPEWGTPVFQSADAYLRAEGPAFTCAWIDGVSPIGPDVFRVCGALPWRLTAGAPFAITFVVGRELTAATELIRKESDEWPAAQRRGLVLSRMLEARRPYAVAPRVLSVSGTCLMGVLLGAFA